MAIVERRLYIRPWLRRFAIVAFVLLIPIGLHTLWDYFEARRLKREVSEILNRGEPVAPIKSRANVEDPDNAARYYDAAVALLDRTGWPNARALLTQTGQAIAEPGHEDILRQVRGVLDRNHQSEQFIAKATELPFKGYVPSIGRSFQFERVIRLAQLARLRTLERLAAGDPIRAADSLIHQLRVVRAFQFEAPSDLAALVSNNIISQAVSDLPALLELALPAGDLRRIQLALRDVDNDHLIEQVALAERAYTLGSSWNVSRGWYQRPSANSPDLLPYIIRPYMTQQLIKEIRLMGDLIEVARRPWPDRLEVSVPRAPSEGTFAQLSWRNIEYNRRYMHRRRSENVAAMLSVSRAGLAAIGVEQYRLSHAGSLPPSLDVLVPAHLSGVLLDPYSGREIRYAHRAGQYVIYSVGPNRKDDGGGRLVHQLQPGRAGALQDRTSPIDLGLEVKLRQRRNQ